MRSVFDFTPSDNANMTLPKDIVQYQCAELSKMTKGLVLGKIQEYDNPIDDYTTGISLSQSLRSVVEEKEVSIQSDLGELSGNEFTYEFFITSKHTTNFVYRVFFLRYGISIYPLRIVLDETIAKEIERNTKEKCESENDFYELLGEILNSDKIKTVVNSLLFINRKAEAEKNAVITEVSENNDNNSGDSE